MHWRLGTGCSKGKARGDRALLGDWSLPLKSEEPAGERALRGEWGGGSPLLSSDPRSPLITRLSEVLRRAREPPDVRVPEGRRAVQLRSRPRHRSTRPERHPPGVDRRTVGGG